MCKVMMFTDASRVKNLRLLVDRVLPLITRNDDDGFGWAAQGSQGHFGERMTEMHHGYRLHLNRYAVSLPIVRKTYETIGVQGDVTGALLLHGRTSTNNVSLTNTHPIQRNDWTLIHNGVVTNRGPEYEMRTTNDTEHLVHFLSTSGIEGIESHLTGYYAFGALAPDGRLHVCRDDKATLYVSWIRSIKSYVFATTADLIETIVDQMKWKRGPIEAVNDNVYTIFQGNKIVFQRNIVPRGYDKREESLMATSLHYLNSEQYKYVDDGAPNETLVDELIAETEQDEISKISENFNLNEYHVESFLQEMRTADGSYTIFNEHDQQIEVHEFRRLDLVSKLCCTVTRPDGTLCTPDNYPLERLA